MKHSERTLRMLWPLAFTSTQAPSGVDIPPSTTSTCKVAAAGVMAPLSLYDISFCESGFFYFEF